MYNAYFITCSCKNAIQKVPREEQNRIPRIQSQGHRPYMSFPVISLSTHIPPDYNPICTHPSYLQPFLYTTLSKHILPVTTLSIHTLPITTLSIHTLPTPFPLQLFPCMSLPIWVFVFLFPFIFLSVNFYSELRQNKILPRTPERMTFFIDPLKWFLILLHD